MCHTFHFLSCLAVRALAHINRQAGIYRQTVLAGSLPWRTTLFMLSVDQRHAIPETRLSCLLAAPCNSMQRLGLHSVRRMRQGADPIRE